MTDETLELGSIIEFSQDISQAEAPPPLPAGTYTGVITAAAQKTSQKGNLMANFEFTVSPDQFPPDFSAIQPDAIKLFYIRMLTDDARNRYQLRKFAETLRTVVGRKVDLNDFMGKQAKLIVKNEPYNGMPQAKIDRVELA